MSLTTEIKQVENRALKIMTFEHDELQWNPQIKTIFRKNGKQL